MSFSVRDTLVALGLSCALCAPQALAGQADRGTGQWWLRSGLSFVESGGGYGDVLDGGVAWDVSVAKGAGSWRWGGGLHFGALQMNPPCGSELEWARLGVFGSATRVFNPSGAVRPYVEARPAVVRMHSRSFLFHDPAADFDGGENATQAVNGVGITLRPGVELEMQDGFALDFSTSFGAYSTGDYDLAPIGGSAVSDGTEWGARVGFTWRPVHSGAASSGADAWGVPTSWGWAMGEMLAVNFGASMLNEFVGSESSYPVTPASWYYNMDRGWRFDDNDFQTNQVIHPFNGATYYNASRANGVGFWGSAGIALFGALVWECCGESQPESWNDVLATGFGGIAWGEVGYRTSSLILDNTARGGNRLFRELAAVPVNPIRQFNRLLSGRAWRISENPANPLDRHPRIFLFQLNGGARFIAEDESLSDARDTYGFVDASILYGDPFENARRLPFDRFDAYVQVDQTGLTRLQIRGDLWSKPLGAEAGSDARWALALGHDFDYVNNGAYEFGGQGFGFALFNRLGTFERRFISRLSVMGIIGAAVNSDYAEDLADIPDARTPRDYDYGTGLGLGFEGILTRSARTLVRVDYRYTGLRVFNGSLYNPTSSIFDFGSDALHRIHRAGLELVVPLTPALGVGVKGSLFYRDSSYGDPRLEDHTQTTPEVRVYVTRQWR